MIGHRAFGFVGRQHTMVGTPFASTEDNVEKRQPWDLLKSSRAHVQGLKDSALSL